MINDELLVEYYELVNDNRTTTGLRNLEIFRLFSELNKKELEILIEKYKLIESNELHIAYVYSAVELSATEQKAIISKLSKEYPTECVTSFRIDKSIFGGLKIVIGDNILDFSFESKINELLNE